MIGPDEIYDQAARDWEEPPDDEVVNVSPEEADPEVSDEF